MEETNLTIKRVYDQYDQKDFSYGTEDSFNLNPKREINLDKLDKLAAKIQEVTDNIIQKRIQPPPPPEEKIKVSLGESMPDGIPLPKQRLLARTGNIGNALIFPSITTGMEYNSIEKLLEQVIGMFPIPELLNNLDGPISLDCDLILKQFEYDEYEFDEEENEDENERENPPKLDENGNIIDGETSPNKSDDDKDEEEGEEESGGDEDDQEIEEEPEKSDMEICAEIELNWLKILLILVKIIKILQMIINLVLSIIVPIIEIIQLAMACWINPPSIGVIIQKVIQLVTAIIVMLMAMLIQFIWNLLNLDCITDQTANLIEQIRRAMSMFSSVMNAFNPNSVDLLKNKLNKEVVDPIMKIAEEAEKKKEAWANLGQQMKDQIGAVTSKEFKDRMMNEMAAGIQNGIMNTPEAGKVQGIMQDAKGLFQDAKDAILSVDQAVKTLSGKNKSSSQKAMDMMNDPAFEGMTFMVD